MADQANATLAKVAKLGAIAREHLQKVTDIHAEIDALLSGKAGIGEQLKRFETTFDQLWGMRYAKGETGRYVWNFVRDRPNTKRLIRIMGVDELERRAGVYIASNEAFYAQNRHTYSLFVSTINSLAAPASSQDFSLEVPAPAGCKHAPACRSDQEHTARRRQEHEA